MKVIGIDPGLTGALAVTDGHGLLVIDMPTVEVRGKKRIDPHGVVDFITAAGAVDHVVLEEVASSPQMGVASAFTFGQGYGIVQGIITALARPWSTVRPQLWTRAMAVGSDKGAHRQLAMRLYPAEADNFQRVKDDGRADAALMATWMLRTHGLGAA